jgi:hypothetical protein
MDKNFDRTQWNGLIQGDLVKNLDDNETYLVVSLWSDYNDVVISKDGTVDYGMRISSSKLQLLEKSELKDIPPMEVGDCCC